MEQILTYAGPELGECIAPHPARHAQRATPEGVSYAGMAVGPPGVGKKVTAHIADVARIRRSQVSVGSVRRESHDHDVFDWSHEGLTGSAEVPGVLSPESAQRRLCRVAGGDAAKPHPVSLAEAAPVRAVLAGTVSGSAEARREHAGGKALRTNRALYEPTHPLPASNGLIAGCIIAEGLRRLRRNHLTGGGASGQEKQNCEPASGVWFHRYWVPTRTRSLPA